MIYLQLFLSFIKIGLLGFGGGMAIIGLIQNEVAHYGWMSSTEFVDIVAISQMTPGPIGINCATYVGYTATGSIWGSVVATLSIILPSLIIMLILSKLYFYLSGHWSESPIYQWTMLVIRAIVIGLIAYAWVRLMSPESFIDNFSWVLFAAVGGMSLLPLLVPATVRSQWSRPAQQAFKRATHPIMLIIVAGVLGWCVYK